MLSFVVLETTIRKPWTLTSRANASPNECGFHVFKRRAGVISARFAGSVARSSG
jgi:hypothetical protein